MAVSPPKPYCHGQVTKFVKTNQSVAFTLALFLNQSETSPESGLNLTTHLFVCGGLEDVVVIQQLRKLL